MNDLTARETESFARALATELGDVIEELQAIEVVDLVSYIRFGCFSALEDLLQSSAELFFKEGTLTFGWTAAVEMAWTQTPKVILGLELKHRAASIFFNLSLCAGEPTITLSGVLFDPPCPAPERLRCLLETVADAHLPRRNAPVHRPAVGPAS